MTTKRIVSVILGGGQGKRLFPLTRDRAKPAVPIGGKYRLVDIPISNSLNANIREIYILTQFNSVSLNRHISTTYHFDNFSDARVQLLAAEQTSTTMDWFQGTADAVRKMLPHCIGGSLEPIHGRGGLLRREKLNARVAEIIEMIGRGNVAVKGNGIELGQDVDFTDTGVKGIRDRNVHEAVFAPDRDRGFGPVAGKRKKPFALSSAEDHRNNTFCRHRKGIISLPT